MIWAIVSGSFFGIVLVAGVLWYSRNWENSPDDIWWP